MSSLLGMSSKHPSVEPSHVGVPPCLERGKPASVDGERGACFAGLDFDPTGPMVIAVWATSGGLTSKSVAIYNARRMWDSLLRLQGGRTCAASMGVKVGRDAIDPFPNSVASRSAYHNSQL